MAMVEDPVCGMRIDSEEAAGTIEYEGKRYYFCSQACHDGRLASQQGRGEGRRCGARRRSFIPLPPEELSLGNRGLHGYRSASGA
jgi:YHS domain-containing protein